MTPKEALEIILDNTTPLDESEKGLAYLKVATDLLKQSLKPTADEVCKALSEYYKMNVNYNSEDKPMFYRYVGGVKKDVIAIYHGGLSISSNACLPPNLITLIGRFYEWLEKEKRKCQD